MNVNCDSWLSIYSNNIRVLDKIEHTPTNPCYKERGAYRYYKKHHK